MTIVVSGPISTVTVLECHGAAGDPRALCSTTTTVGGPVASVTACNGSANGGGAVLRCSVTVTGAGGASATVRQCVGSGDGLTIGCVPVGGPPGADIESCNGSANGGTLVGLICTAAGVQGTRISLCNGSGNGGGGLVVCSVGGAAARDQSFEANSRRPSATAACIIGAVSQSQIRHISSPSTAGRWVAVGGGTPQKNAPTASGSTAWARVSSPSVRVTHSGVQLMDAILRRVLVA